METRAVEPKPGFCAPEYGRYLGREVAVGNVGGAGVSLRKAMKKPRWHGGVAWAECSGTWKDMSRVQGKSRGAKNSQRLTKFWR
jgi:hypothetical protein